MNPFRVASHIRHTQRMPQTEYHCVGFGGVCRCMRGDLMWTCLVWAERSTSDKFGCQATDSIPPQVNRKVSLKTIYTDSELPSRMPNSLMPSAKPSSANLPFLTSLGVTLSGIQPRPPAPRADALTTSLRRGGFGLIGSNWAKRLPFMTICCGITRHNFKFGS